jgi:phospholipid/cholesterol/gamma-HCH transport system substrate-binding protein
VITRRTKMQLLVFALITVLGVSYVGARYAKLDRFFRDDTYAVVAHFQESGGIFAGAEVTYRGVGIGTVKTMEATEDGVDVVLEIDRDYDRIPAETKAVVGNRSAVGEQFVELQPQRDDGPYLEEDAEIPVEMTETPIQTDVLLTNLSNLVESVDREALRTTVD